MSIERVKEYFKSYGMEDKVMEDNNGNKTAYTAYSVRVTDEDGEVWECEVKPQRNSDKALLNFLLIELGKQAKKAAAETAA